MLRVYTENINNRGQLPMSIQTLGNRGDLQAWAELYKETAVEMGHDPTKLNGEARMEVGLMVCRKMLQRQS